MPSERKSCSYQFARSKEPYIRPVGWNVAVIDEVSGLVSIIDEHIFGDIKSFRSQFSRLNTDGDFRSLRERLKPICTATSV